MVVLLFYSFARTAPRLTPFPQHGAQTCKRPMASHSPHSSLTSYDDDDIDDDAWANFDLSGAIDQHQRCSSSQLTATLGRSSPTQFAGAATTGAAASSMCDDDIDDDAWANFDLSGAI